MEKNIFKGAKFGDKFLTRDGRIGILIMLTDYAILSIYQTFGKGFSSIDRDYNLNGTTIYNESDCLDIISKYQEPINEYKLDEYAHNYYKRHYDFANYMLVTESYKAGYRSAFNNKAKEK